MKFSEAWLREWVNPPIDTKTLVNQLNMAGLEVDALTKVAGDFKGVVVGFVVSAEQHPNADRLRVCQVDVGAADKLTIVCGASNVRAGLKVAVAVVGAVLPDNFTIKPAKLRGVESHGMICSADELKLCESSEGILELDPEAPIGMDLRVYLQLDDHIFDLDLTPNRGDCLSVFGVAREVAAINDAPIPQLPSIEVSPTSTTVFSVDITVPEDCPYYVGRVIENIQMDAPTPFWLKEKLRRSGLRSIHLVVDVTNYVLLELGQPLHAFDLDKLHDALIVRRATEGEKLVLLDGRTITLSPEILVIADKKGPLALAGIMGGLDSAITDSTHRLFLESAFFNPLTIVGRARAYGLSTDASHRFERFVSPELSRVAIECATQLLLEIAGGSAGPLTIVKHDHLLPKPPTITLRSEQVSRLLGVALTPSEIAKLLMRLNMHCVETEKGFEVTAPLYRFDVQQEADLIEEIARMYGYENIAPTQASIPTSLLNRLQHNPIKTDIERFLVDRGYYETITYSFIDPDKQALLYPNEKPLLLKNPISPELSAMRTSLWPGLLQAVSHNQRYQQSRVRLFEIGLCFRQEKTELSQNPFLAGVLTHTRYPEQWSVTKQALDFFDAKADVEGLFRVMGQCDEVTFQSGAHSALHPGQTAEIFYRDESVGYVGALHPKICQQLELEGPIYLFEIALSAFEKQQPAYHGISKFPAVRRDIAVVLDKNIAAQEILAAVKRVGGESLKDTWIFDVYQGKNMEVNQKSLAIGLIWQHLDRTLLEEEIVAQLQAVINTLKAEFAAILRE